MQPAPKNPMPPMKSASDLSVDELENIMRDKLTNSSINDTTCQKFRLRRYMELLDLLTAVDCGPTANITKYRGTIERYLIDL